jgi:hypothetical protein
MSLFTKRISEVQFDDVNNFFNLKLREDLRLDYKADFPSDPAQLIIAFANTAGGIILIGIKANKTTNIPEAILGVPLTAGLEEKVTDIAMSRIRPPIAPEVKVCSYKSQADIPQADRAIVVIRVSQSEMSPHSDVHNNAIWIRNHNKCEQASLDTIEQLLERRDKRTQMRERMEQEVNEVATKALHELPLRDGRLRYYEIRFSPAFPLRITFDKSTDDFLTTQINTIERTDNVYIKLGGIDFTKRSRSDNRLSRLFSFSRNGSLINIEPLEMPSPEEVYAERAIQILAKMLRASVRIFEHFEYFGRLSIQVTVGDIRGIKLSGLIPKQYAFPFDEPRISLEGDIRIEESRSLDDIKENETVILSSVYNDLLRGFQISLRDTDLKWRLDYLLKNLP